MAIRNRLADAISTWFGCGYAPKAPGTAGSAAAIALAILIEHYTASKPGWFALLALAISVPGIWAAGVTARRRNLKDPGIVVVDEVAGQWLALGAARVLNWKSYLAAFLLFRLFDIWKPPPARQAESLPGGLGIVADDLIAGAYAALVLWLLGWFSFF
jgi:phosphatidylglycerophosphatase A